MTEKNKPEGETLEDMLAQIENEKKTRRPKTDWSKYIPVGWRRLTDEQRKSLQETIYRFLEMNKETKVK
jgi:hypothetical protein